MNYKKTTLQGEIDIPCDKSITHRSILFPSIAVGDSIVRFGSIGRDNIATLRVMRELGVEISGKISQPMAKLFESEGVLEGFDIVDGKISEIIIKGRGFKGLTEPSKALDCGNSGTTSRLLCGILASCDFSSTITGDESLRSRPFLRITEPLSMMGAHFDGNKLPLSITGSELHGISYDSPKASAQVKSAILLAGLQAEGDVKVSESVQSRNHTELMLSAMSCNLSEKLRDDGRWLVSLPQSGKPKSLSPLNIEIPGDFSAASFFLVAASITPDSRVLITNVCFNESRIGLFELLVRMGASIKIHNDRVSAGERVVDLFVSGSDLNGIQVSAEDVVRAIDEIPVLCVAAAFAKGTTEIRGAEELRVKESDRISMTCNLLATYGISFEELDDGLIIRGKSFNSVNSQSEQVWQTSGDHRISMSGAVLELALKGDFKMHQVSVVETSFPFFADKLRALISSQAPS